MAFNGPSTPYSVIVWEWKNQFDMWEVYEPRAVDYLERHYQANPSASVPLAPLSSLYAQYTVRFSSSGGSQNAGVQCNLGSGRLRDVRRRIVSSAEPGGVAEGVMWLWRDDASPQQWSFYPTEISQMIEECKKGLAQSPSAPSVIDIQNRFHRYPYTVDLVRCCQMRKTTGFSRQIRRQTTLHFPRADGSPIPTQSGVPITVQVGASASRSTGGPTQQSNNSGGTSGGAVGTPSVLSPFPTSNSSYSSPFANASGSTSANPPPSTSSRTMPSSTNATSGSPSTNANDYSWRLAHPHPSSKKAKIFNNVENQNADPSRDVVTHYTSLVPADEVAANMSTEDCNICMEKLTNDSGFGDDAAVCRLSKCGHEFHQSCLRAMVNSGGNGDAAQNLRCPSCKTDHGERKGVCPSGYVTYYTISSRERVAGFNDADGAIVIEYHINGGTQGTEHPQPGRRYHCHGFPRTCFLPNNPKGRLILQLLIIAWERRLTFTVGTSTTTSMEDCVIWNEIHHKTGSPGHSFPDPNYLDNVIAELASQGVSTDDLPAAMSPTKRPRLSAS